MPVALIVPAAPAMLANSAHALRLSAPGLNETWWVAGLLAGLAVVLAYQLETRHYGKPTWMKAQRVVGALVLLALYFTAVMVSVTVEPRWQPAEDASEFHRLVSKRNYAALHDEMFSRVDESKYFEKPLPIEGSSVMAVYFRDAWNQPMWVAGNHLVSAGPDRQPRTADDIVLPDPADAGTP